MKTLAIDASRTAEPQKTGVGWYCHHLLQHLKDVIPHDVRVILYSDQPLPEELRPWPENWKEQVLRRWGPMWSQVRLVAQVLRDRPDVFFVPAHVIPELLASFSPSSRGGARGGARLRLITTIHDVVFKQFPDSYSTRERWYADHATRLAVRHADRIIVPTEAVKRDLGRWYGVDFKKVSVIHHGVAPPVSSRGGEADEGSHTFVQQCQDVRSLLPEADRRSARDDEGRIVLYVGRLERKKNVARMVEAFSHIAPQHLDLKLVLAGPSGFGCEEVRAAIDRSPVRDRIIETGWVDQVQYHEFLRRATIFLFPTLGEGFGLPILEAMAAGVPVITSSGGAHGEVASDAALLVDPESTEEIAAAIDRTLRDADLRSDLVHRGRQRVAQFTWTRSAQHTWNVLRDVLFT